MAGFFVSVGSRNLMIVGKRFVLLELRRLRIGFANSFGRPSLRAENPSVTKKNQRYFDLNHVKFSTYIGLYQIFMSVMFLRYL
jgi:hypothetical protein